MIDFMERKKFRGCHRLFQNGRTGSGAEINGEFSNLPSSVPVTAAGPDRRRIPEPAKRPNQREEHSGWAPGTVGPEGSYWTRERISSAARDARLLLNSISWSITAFISDQSTTPTKRRPLTKIVGVWLMPSDRPRSMPS